MNVVRCPHCNVRITYSGSRDGQTIPCPKCHHPFQFPAATQGPPVPTSASRPDLSFVGDPEPAYGSDSKEPWFHGYLETYSRFGMWLGVVLVLLMIVLLLSGTIYAMVIGGTRRSTGVWWPYSSSCSSLPR